MIKTNYELDKEHKARQAQSVRNLEELNQQMKEAKNLEYFLTRKIHDPNTRFEDVQKLRNELSVVNSEIKKLSGYIEEETKVANSAYIPAESLDKIAEQLIK